MNINDQMKELSLDILTFEERKLFPDNLHREVYAVTYVKNSDSFHLFAFDTVKCTGEIINEFHQVASIDNRFEEAAANYLRQHYKLKEFHEIICKATANQNYPNN